MQKLLTFFFSKNISIFAIFYDQSFNNLLTNDIISFEQLGLDLFVLEVYSFLITSLSLIFTLLIYLVQYWWMCFFQQIVITWINT